MAIKFFQLTIVLMTGLSSLYSGTSRANIWQTTISLLHPTFGIESGDSRKTTSQGVVGPVPRMGGDDPLGAGPAGEPAERKSQEMGDFVYTFANGQTLTFIISGPRQGVYFGSKSAVEADPMISGSVNEIPNGAVSVSRNPVPRNLLQVAHDRLSKRAILVYVDLVPYVINQSGTVRELRGLSPPKKNVDGTAGWREWARFENGGHSFIVIQTVWEAAKKIGTVMGIGETFVIRDDGLFVRAWIARKDYHNTVVQEHGILRVEGYRRRIDLNAFAMEATLHTQIPRIATNADGGDKPIDPWESVTSLFSEVERSSRPRALNGTSKEVVESVVTALTTSMGSAVIFGETGSGKSELAQQVINHLPRTWAMIRLSPEELHATGRYAGNFEARLLAILAVAEFYPVVWFMDEIHAMRGLGVHQGQPNDIFEKIKPLMATGQLRLLGTSTDRDFNKFLADDPALMRRIVRVPHNGFKDDEVQDILMTWVKEQRRISLSPEILQEIMTAAKRFDPFTMDPARSLRLLQTLFSVLEPEQVDISSDDVRFAIRKSYSIPPAFTDFSSAVNKLEELKTELDRRLPGNDKAKVRLLEAAGTALFNLNRRERPLVSGAFAGPKGVGKSALVINYAEIMGLPFLRLEMNQYSEYSDVKSFLFKLGDFLRSNPFGVVLFDEIDKASQEVRNALLGALESNQFTFSKFGDLGGDTPVRVNVLNAQLFFATNAGQGTISQAFRAGRTVDDSVVALELSNQLGEFLVDRLGFVVAMYPASENVYRQIVDRELRYACERAQIKPEQIINWDEMVDQFSAAKASSPSNRDPQRMAENITRSVVNLLQNRKVDSVVSLSSLLFLFDPKDKSLVVHRPVDGGGGSCENLIDTGNRKIHALRPRGS